MSCSTSLTILLVGSVTQLTQGQQKVSLTPEQQQEVTELESARTKLNQTLWASETLAQAYEKKFLVPFWNRLIHEKVNQRLNSLGEIPFETLSLPQKKKIAHHPLNMTELFFEDSVTSYDRAAWQKKLHHLSKEGWFIEHTDWHQAAFFPSEKHPKSEVNFRIQACNQAKTKYAEINGTLLITWKGPDPAEGGAVPKVIAIQKIRIKERKGKPLFEQALHVDATQFGKVGSVIPATIVYDFNNDGLPEILQASVGAIFWNRGNFQFEIMPYTKNSQTFLDAAVVDDFNGDGKPDLLGVTSERSFAFFAGHDHQNTGSPFSKDVFIFDPPGENKIESTCTITSGDIDGDGDSDIWIGQWKSPYHVMPKRYYDANDGHSSMLLLNDGTGTFTEGTHEAGLNVRQHRRSYSGSFVDLDDDDDLDLLTVNDFAGVDTYHNDGKGHFTLVTDKILDEWHNFGMSHTMGDFNSDGKLDFYVQGMSSTTARRLDRMKAGPDELKEHNKMRSVMGYGNRMYLAGDKGTFQQPSFKDRVARTGWSWGSTSFDFNNDGHLDIFVANGHISGKSTQDHCTNFWCHEIYLPEQRTKKNSQKAIMTFLNESLGTPEISWDGYQPNRFFLNQNGKDFLESSYLLGAGHVKDSRTAISADFDADGRQDLLFGYHDYQEDISHLQVLKNNTPQGKEHHWLGVHLHGPAIGAKVTVTAGDRTFIAQQINGDSYQSQHPNTKHFGLGKITQVEKIEIRWPSGKTTMIKDPKLNQYHIAKAAK